MKRILLGLLALSAGCDGDDAPIFRAEAVSVEPQAVAFLVRHVEVGEFVAEGHDGGSYFPSADSSSRSRRTSAHSTRCSSSA
ncbi:MAG: hypothetical protein JKY37_00610, partial [Nannocystaceae bacterium]|nr:hypothetical protein [Nannocystaceae bacterium]